MKSKIAENKWIYRAEAQSARSLKSVLTSLAKLLLVMAVTILLSEVLYDFYFGNQNIIMLYLLSVLIISFITPSYLYGILSALICTFVFDFLYTQPRMDFSFTIGLPVTLLFMLGVTFATSTLAMQLKAKAGAATEREHRTHAMYEFSQRLMSARDMDTIVSVATEHLATHLNLPVKFYTQDPALADDACFGPQSIPQGQQVLYTQEQRKQVHRMFKFGEAETERPVNDAVYDVYNIPVISRNKVFGVIGIACENHIPPSPGSRHFVRMLAGQVAAAMEIQSLSDEQQSISMEAEKEKMRATLLRSISHDLRTPLTSILGASSTILEQKDLDEQTLESLVKDIKLDAQWLIRMVENILIITRISGDNLKVSKTMEAAEEVVSEAVSIVRKRFPDYIIRAHIPDDLVIVPMDATLISQVLINLLENAVKNSPDGSLILVDLKQEGPYAVFDVSDNGQGIPAHLLDSLFEVHSPTKEQAVDASRGMGIGLSICKTIVQAHGGYIEGHNRTKNGAKFTFRLPLKEMEADA